jgi:hypothetical protein
VKKNSAYIFFVAEICILEFTMGLLSFLWTNLANKPHSKLQNVYLGEKIRYYYDSLIPFDLLNILYRLVSMVMHIFTS